MANSKTDFTQFSTNINQGMDQAMKMWNESTQTWNQVMNQFMQECEGITRTQMDATQKVLEKCQNASKSMMSCQTISELADVNSQCARELFDICMNNATKMSEQAVKGFTKAIEPVNDQIAKSMEQARKAA